MAGSVVIVGGTAGIGLALARRYAGDGRRVVITGRDAGRAREVAATVTGTAGVEARGFDLAEPAAIDDALAGVDRVDRLVLAAIERDDNAVREYDVARATRLVTLKLVGYTEVVHALAPRLGDEASILVFGGLAMMRPYPGSTTVTTVNGGVSSMVRSLAIELAPVRANAIHPGIVGDTPAWSGKPPAVLEAVRARTPLGRLVMTDEIVDAAAFLLENGAVNGVNLPVDGGWLLT
ncbi:MAG TPA: SDR family oxidoreductase [Gaiellaceae bacterium]|jgi:NAD(P)-dependent dehydrogenase (short-subunit alcohol dehydrogenase family)